MFDLDLGGRSFYHSKYSDDGFENKLTSKENHGLDMVPDRLSDTQ